MRKSYPICDCSGNWIECANEFESGDPWVYMFVKKCYFCGIYPYGSYHNDDMMRDLQEMNQ